MPLIPGDELRLVSKLFGLSQQALAGITNIDDRFIDQVLTVNELVRRGKTTGGQGAGWGQGILENVHAVGDGQLSSIDPYNPGVDAVAPFPTAVDDDWDIWLYGASGLVTSGLASLTAAGLGFSPPSADSQMWGRDDSGAAVVGIERVTLAFWDGVNGDLADIDPMLHDSNGQFYMPLNLRIPRGALLRFNTESVGASTYRCLLYLGLFPAALGQDLMFGR